MTALPPATDFTDATVTEGQFKVALTNLRGFLAGLFGDTGEIGDARTALGLGSAATRAAGPGDDNLPTAADVAAFMRGHIAGLTLANSTGDANNDITIAAGVATADDQSTVMRLTSALTKRLDATWSAGTDLGGLDTGSKATNTWYHVWLIRRSDTGGVDALFSTSASNPVLPTSYDQKRRVGAVRTDGSGNIRAFQQFGDLFRWVTPIHDVSLAAFAGPSDQTLTVPPIAGIQAQLYGAFANATSGTELYIDHPDETQTNGACVGRSQVSTVGAAFGLAVIPVNGSAQVTVATSNANSTVSIYTRGYIDSRGRFA